MKSPSPNPHDSARPEDTLAHGPLPELRAHAMPPHPFKRDLVVRSDDGSTQIRDLTKVVEASRVCPINAYVKLQEEDRLFNKIEAGYPVAVRGVWRMGKTEMLATMFSRKGLLDDTISLNFEEPPARALVNVALPIFRAQIGRTQVAEFLARKKLLSAQHPEDLDFSTLIEQTKTILDQYDGGSRGGPFDLLSRYLSRSASHAYVVFDEAILLSYAPELVQEVSRISQLPGIRSIVVLQKHRVNDEHFLKVFGRHTEHFVECLDFDDCARIGKALVAGTNLEFTPGAIAVVREWSGGRPFEVSAMCHLAIDTHSKSNSEDPKIKATEIREGFEERLRDRVHVVTSVLAPAVENYLKIFHLGLNQDERDVMQRMARSTAIHIEDMPPDLLPKLEKFSLIAITGKAGESKFVRVNGELLRAVLDRPELYSKLDHWARDEYWNDGV